MGLDCLSDYEARPPTMTAMHRAAEREAGTDVWSWFCSYMNADGDAWRRRLEKEQGRREAERNRQYEKRRQAAAAAEAVHRRECAAREREEWLAWIRGDGGPEDEAAEVARINAEIDRINAEAGECR